MKVFEEARIVELPPTRVAEGVWDRAVKRRRRRRGVQAGAFVAAAAVAAGTYLVSTASTNKVELPPSAVALKCSGQDSKKLPIPKAHALPEGATQALLCPVNGAYWQPPSDPLTSDLDRLVGTINSQPEGTPEPKLMGQCMGDHVITDYSITLAYPDGTTLAIWGEPLCDRLWVGGQPGVGGKLVLRTYLEALASQRSSQPAPSPLDTTVSCPSRDGLFGSIVPSGTELDLRVASACRYRWTEVSPGGFAFVLEAEVSLGPTEIDLLNQGFRENARPIEPDYDVGNQLITVVGVNSWGDQIYLQLLDDGLVRAPSAAQPGSPSLGWAIPLSGRARLSGE